MTVHGIVVVASYSIGKKKGNFWKTISNDFDEEILS